MATWKALIDQCAVENNCHSDELAAFDYHLRRGVLLAVQTLNVSHELTADSFGKTAAEAWYSSTQAIGLWGEFHCACWPKAGVVELGHVVADSAAQAAVIYLNEYVYMLNLHLHLAEFPNTEMCDSVWGAFNRISQNRFPRRSPFDVQSIQCSHE